MSVLVAAYSKAIYKEFLLPNIKDTDYQILLDRDLFGIERSVTLSLEAIEGEWHIYQQPDYQMIKDEHLFFGDVLNDKDIIILDLLNGMRISLMIMKVPASLASAHKYIVDPKISAIKIGTDRDNHILYDYMGLVSRHHAVIRRHGSEYILEDYSANGIFIGTSRMEKRHSLKFGDFINIFGLRIVFLGNMIAVYSYGQLRIDETALRSYSDLLRIKTVDSMPAVEKEKKKFHRSPRSLPKLHDEEIEIEAPPIPRPFARRPILMTIGPSFTMAIPMIIGCLLAIYSTSAESAGAFMYTGIITAVGSAVFGIMWALINLRYEKKNYKQEEEYRFQAYSDYLIELTEGIKKKYEENRQILQSLYPETSICADYTEQTMNLWNRNNSHSDFMFARLGIGEVPFQVSIKIPPKKFAVTKDELSERPSMIKKSYDWLKNVPVGVNFLEHRVMGIVGEKGTSKSMDVLRNIIVQLAATHCYTDLKMAFIYQDQVGAENRDWEFVKWLPHVWSEDKKNRYVASNRNEAGDVFYELAGQLRNRFESEDRKKDDSPVCPHYLLVVESPSVLEGSLIAKYVFDQSASVGLTTLMMADSFEELPNKCEHIIQFNAEFSGVYSIRNSTWKLPVKFDDITAGHAELFARRISGIEVNEVETGGELPSSLDFFEMYGVSALEQFKVLERWRKNRTYDTMSVLVGQKTGGGCYLDIHEKYHGPHGLIAGTTGSGKSETLQTYMLSLAVNYSPLDIAFFIIDFKGGGMANLFSSLPHTIGQISNLSGNQVRRAMISIKSENMRRQRIFGEFGVNHINGYTRLLKNGEAAVPVPHLFIIIDEFAELKREEPEFMRELISVAQVGRSLGVHLILATQKPSGTVDDNIWSNAKFRLCLRVQDRQDSNDMLHKPDAAYITQAGRCYMQVGNDEVFELFQSGWSGAAYRENTSVIKSELAKMYTLTGKAALVGSRTVMKEHLARRTNWLLSIAETVRSTALSCGFTLEDCQQDTEKMKLVLTKAFDVFPKIHIDYTDSSHNRKCLEGLVQAWNLVESPELNAKQIVEGIIRQAPLLGIRLPEMKEKTQLDAIVQYLDGLAKENGYTNHLQLWLPVLPETLYLSQLEGYDESSFADGIWPEAGKEWRLEAFIGLYDDPINQAQKPLILDFAGEGHHAVCGTVVSGKSTYLQTLVYSLLSSYSPTMLNVYLIDFSSHMLSAFEEAPHVGGAMYENDHDKLQKFFHMIGVILEERKQIFRGGNYSQYVQSHGVTIPALMIVIDNVAGFREKTGNAYEEILIQLSRDGAGYGIFLVLSSAGFGSTEIPNRVGDNIRRVVCLEMGDKFKYADAMHTMRIDVLPEPGIRGRGLADVAGNLLEFQTALAVKAEDDYQRSEKLREICACMCDTWKGKCARRIPEIPEKPTWNMMASLEEYHNLISGRKQLPLAYNKADASVCCVDLAHTYCFVIQGRSRSGKTNVLMNLVESAHDMGGEICIIDDKDKSLGPVAEGKDVTYITDAAGMYAYWTKLLPMFQQRNKRKSECVGNGAAEEEIFEIMHTEFDPIWIFISNISEFVQTVYQQNTEPEVGAMSGFLENIAEKGSLHNIYFFGGLNPEDGSLLSGYKLYNCMVEYKTGLHLGGNVASQRIFDFSGIPFAEQTRVQKPGAGLMPSAEPGEYIEVVIPLHGGKSNEYRRDV